MDLARGSGFQGKRETLRVHLILDEAAAETSAAEEGDHVQVQGGGSRHIGYVLLPPGNTVHFYRVPLAEVDASIERLYWLYVSR